jgi:hypothetical protein
VPAPGFGLDSFCLYRRPSHQSRAWIDFVLGSAAWEANTVQEILKPGVGPERIEDRSQEEGCRRSSKKGLPVHGSAAVPEHTVA